MRLRREGGGWGRKEGARRAKYDTEAEKETCGALVTEKNELSFLTTKQRDKTSHTQDEWEDNHRGIGGEREHKGF